jgi:serine/threonine protein kinase
MRRSRTAAPSGPVVIDGFSDLVAIGSGGFSMVYRAHELALDRAVAVKVLNTGLSSDRERRDFERECKALGQLNHPDVVTVYRPAFSDDGRPCIVMALYERNFRDQLDATGPLPPAELLDVGIRMAVALHVAHRRGVLHRDVKPHNIFRSVYGDPALGDFGISTLAGERSHDRSTALSLAYVAPEILDDAAPSAQADVYSLAATLHHLATGRAPFDAKEPSRVVAQVLHDEPPPLGRSDLPPSFERVLRVAMAKDPAQRPADARAFAEMLREVQARAGLSPTPLKLDIDEARTVAPVVLRDDGVASTGVRDGRRRRQQEPLAPAPPPRVATPVAPERPTPVPPPIAGPASARSADVESTVVRRVQPPPAPEPVEAGPSRRRWWIATALAVVALAAVVTIIVATSGGSPSTATTTSVASSLPPDTFFTPLAAPAGVTVTPATGGSFAVAIPAVAGATGYQIERTTGGDVIAATPEQLPILVDGRGATTLCVVVRAVGNDGRISRDAGPFCG